MIGILLSVFQQAIGINAVLYYAPRIFENAGAEGGGMMQTVIMGIVNIIFTLVAIFTVDRFGRKPLLIIGSIGMAVGAFAGQCVIVWQSKVFFRYFPSLYTLLSS